MSGRPLGLGFLFDLVCPWLAILLFYTAPGRTFLEGRSGRPLQTDVTLTVVSGVSLSALFFLVLVLSPLMKRLWLAVSLVLAHIVIGFIALANTNRSGAEGVVFVVFAITAGIQGVVLVWLEHLYDIASSLRRARNKTRGRGNGKTET